MLPNRIGAIRGLNGHTLGDLAAQLDTVIQQQADILAGLAELRGAGPENTLRSINQSLWNIAGPAPGTSLTDLAAAIQAGGAGGATESTVQAILDAIGTLASYPADWTVKQLLAALRGSIDVLPEEGIPPDSPGLNDDIDGGTGWDWEQRAVLIDTGGWDDINGVTYTIYGIQWPDMPNVFEPQSTPYITRISGAWGSAHPDPSFQRIGISWNFTGNTNVSTRYSVLQSASSPAVDAPSLSFPMPATHGITIKELHYDTSTAALAAYFGVVEGQPMPQNVFIHGKAYIVS